MPTATAGLGRNFHRFLIATSLATIATACVRFALSWHIVQVTGSAALFASIVAASHFAEVYAKPVLAPFGDCFRRLGVIRWSFAASFVLAAALVAALWWWTFSPALLTGLLIAMSIVNGLRDPAAAALVPSLVGASQLTQAQSLRSTVASAIGLAGSILGGVVTASADPVTAIVAAGVLIAAGTVVIALVAAPDDQGTQTTLAHFARTWHRRTVDGLAAVWATRAERFNSLAAAFVNMGITPLTTLVMPLWVIQGLGGSPLMLAGFETALGVGVIAGSYAGPRLFNRWFGRGMASVVGPLATGLAVVIAGLLRSPPLIALLMFVCGFCFTVLLVNGSTLRALATPGAFRARMIAGFAFVATCSYPFVSRASGELVERFSSGTMVIACGVLIMLAAVITAANTDALRLWAQSDDAIGGAYERLYPGAFPRR